MLEAQRNYLAFGACEREWLDSVRSPQKTDRRPEGWQTLEDAAETARERTIAEIIQAFDGVSREDGVTLHEADVIDGYGTEAERLEARLLDREPRWQNVPENDIERYNWILSFLDPKGWRYYIPAYMVWSLQHYRTSDSLSCDMTIYSLDLDNKADLRAFSISRFSVLTETQSKAVWSFLRFMRDYGLGHADDVAAKRALKQYWGRYHSEDTTHEPTTDDQRDHEA